jgi:1,4-alpha-glucan branching enzyme
VLGTGSEGPKRDPHARELDTPFPGDCIVRSADFPWHDSDYLTHRFEDFVIYQLHVGTFHAPNLQGSARHGGSFLDVARRIPSLAELGITALQLLPIQEPQTRFSLGYNGIDYFSPEMDFAVADAELAPYIADLNALLDAQQQPRWQPATCGAK